MRSYAQIVPTFWTRGSGRKLRGHPNAQVLALYLMTAPSSNLVGLYYQALTTICHETGLSEAEVRDELPKLTEIAHYDFDAELVWLPECARYQIGEAMDAKDKRRNAVEREIAMVQGHPFAEAFLDRYGEPFGLRIRSKTKPLPAVVDAPSKGLPASEKPPFLAPALARDPDSGSGEREGGEAADLQVRASRIVENSTLGDFEEPQSWPEVVTVVREANRALGLAEPRLGAFSRDSAVRAVVGLYADGRTHEELMTAAGAMADDEYCKRHRLKGASMLTPAVVTALLSSSGMTDGANSLLDAADGKADRRRARGHPKPLGTVVKQALAGGERDG